jgi:hypothetical protein
MIVVNNAIRGWMRFEITKTENPRRLSSNSFNELVLIWFLLMQNKSQKHCKTAQDKNGKAPNTKG